MSESHLSTRPKTCMHLKKFQLILVFAGQEHNSGTSTANKEQVQYWAPLITYFNITFKKIIKILKIIKKINNNNKNNINNNKK